MFAIEISNLNKYYGKHHVLKDINLTIEQGDIVGILGVNGAGKSSLISAIARINNFNTGTIKVMGFDNKKNERQAKKQLGVVVQELAFDPILKIDKVLKLQTRVYETKFDQVWYNEIVDKLCLRKYLHSVPKLLSGGTKRRMMVARALIHKPPIIILDEPTTGVDVEIRKNLWCFIKQLHNQGHTLIITSHYLHEIEYLCNSIKIIDNGSIILESEVRDLIQTNHKVLKVSFTGKMPDSLNKILIDKQNCEYTFNVDKNYADVLLILQELKNQSCEIFNISINEQSLEDIFVNLIKKARK